MIPKASILEFITVAAEYCSLVENTESYGRSEFLDRSQKILVLLYLKALLLPVLEYDDEWYPEKYVTERDWMIVQQRVSEKLGGLESYFDLTEPAMLESGTTVNVSTSECFADIYQDVRDFIEGYRELSDGTDESLAGLTQECKTSFENYWGIRAVRLMSELHLMLFGGLANDDLD